MFCSLNRSPFTKPNDNGDLTILASPMSIQLLPIPMLHETTPSILGATLKCNNLHNPNTQNDTHIQPLPISVKTSTTPIPSPLSSPQSVHTVSLAITPQCTISLTITSQHTVSLNTNQLNLISSRQIELALTQQ